MSKPLEDYALLGDGQAAALLNKEGSIDWLCWPRFDDDACLAALLGTEENGHWSICPAGHIEHVERRYRDDTLIIETDFKTCTGAVRLIDFMPPRGASSAIVRIAVGLEGTVAIRSTLKLRFDYGLVSPLCRKMDGGMTATIGPSELTLSAPSDLTVTNDLTTGNVNISKGQRLAYVLRYSLAGAASDDIVNAEQALIETQDYWSKWVSQFDESKTRWPAVLKRSLITLKAMIHEKTGGLIAAPTTSLPEIPGGNMNWDYRYCWLRDASFSLGALVAAGFHAEAKAWRDWLLRAVAGAPDKMKIMYRVDGTRHLPEWTVEALDGYRGSTPVRVGNSASTQHQVDVLGEVLNCLFLAREGGIPVSEQETVVSLQLARRIEEIWASKGSGIWESRGAPRHYTYSKVMAWVGIDRFLRGRDWRAQETPMRQHFEQLREKIHHDVCVNGWNEGLQAFTQYYGGQALDASLLLMPLVGFLPIEDPRILATITATERELMSGGFVRRQKAVADGANEGTFLACSCWMADCLQLSGRPEEAHAQFERVLAAANDLGLASEEYDSHEKCLLGNFPQALTHLAIVNTGLLLSGSLSCWHVRAKSSKSTG